MSDFTFLRGLNGLEELAGYCNGAENFVESDPQLSATYARKAVEFLVKYIYRKKGVKFAYNAPLFELINGEIVRELLDDNIMQQLHMVRFIGNNAAHNQKVNKTESLLALEKLHFCAGEILILLGDINSYPIFVIPGSKPTEPRPPIKPPEQPRPKPIGIEKFRKYLQDEGYSPTTVNAYVSAVKYVIGMEGRDFQDVCNNINVLVIEYAPNGRKEILGAKGHNTVISALRRLREFVGAAEVVAPPQPRPNPFVSIKEKFYDYLTKRNYSANTINSYVSAINRVAEWEATDWKGVYDNIELLCYEYSQGGIKGDKGMIGHNTIISALRRYCEFAGDCKIE